MPEFIAMLGSAPGPRLGQVPTNSYMGQMPDFSYQSIAKYGDLRGLGNVTEIEIEFPLGEMDDSAFSSYNLVWDAMRFAYKFLREKGTSDTAVADLQATVGSDKAMNLGGWALLWMKKNGRDSDLMSLASVKDIDGFSKAVLGQYDKFIPTLSMFQGTSRANLSAIAAKRIIDNVFTTAADTSCGIDSCADLHFGALMAAAVGAQYAAQNATSRNQSSEMIMASFKIPEGKLISSIPAADKIVAAPIAPPHYVDLATKIVGSLAAVYLGFWIVADYKAKKRSF